MRILASPRLLLCAAAACCSIVWGSRAHACGGLFCSSSAPVDQAAERIVFAQNPDDTVTAIIEIQYSGPAERFAWLLPIAGTPEIGISSSNAIDAISQATSPRYLLERRIEGTCDEPEYDEEAGGDDDAASIADGGATSPPILVLSSGTVGPFDFVVIQPNPDLDDKAEVALDWLTENDYDVTSIGPEVLRPYLESGLNLVAFRLTKDNDVGSIRPVIITYPGTQPSIPIRPTAVAAQDDMGILVWVLGDVRAVPENYLMLTLNESRINWFNWMSGYNELVSEAANEAGGHGFVTEFAGASSILASVAYGSRERSAWNDIQAYGYTGLELIQFASYTFRNTDGFREAIAAAVTLPEGVTIDEFGRSPEYYGGDAGVVIDSDVFKSSLFDLVIEPLRLSQEIFDSRPYLTRMYTTLSANEMIADPLFIFNPDLPDVSNEHVAELVVYCSEEYYEWTAPSTLILPNGERIEGAQGGFPEELADGPATSEVAQASSSGPVEVLIDNGERISDVISSLPEPPPAEAHDPNDDVVADDDNDTADDDVSSGGSDDDGDASGADDDAPADDTDDDVSGGDDTDPTEDDDINDAGTDITSRPVAEVTSEDDGWCTVHGARSHTRLSEVGALLFGLLLLRRRNVR